MQSRSALSTRLMLGVLGSPQHPTSLTLPKCFGALIMLAISLAAPPLILTLTGRCGLEGDSLSTSMEWTAP